MTIQKTKKSFIYRNTYYKPLEIRLSLLSHDKVLRRSSGEVTKASTINYKTLEPETDGLFCGRIFKTNYKNNYICTVCSFRQTNPYRCSLCGSNTKLDKSNIQNLSMGHINLISPVAHPWFIKAKIIQSLYAGCDGVFDYKEIEKIVQADPEKVYYYFKNMDLLNILFESKKQYLGILLNLNEHEEMYNINTSINHANTIQKKIRIISSFIRLRQRPEWMFIKHLPVLSPTYRPLRVIGEKLFISSDINYLYQRVLERNNSFKKLLSKYIINEYTSQLHSDYSLDDSRESNPVVRAKINLQKAVIELIDPSFAKPSTGIKGKSIINRLSGKEGRFRKDILGKRINFSGRTVITSGPRLRMNQCGLPIELIFELFKPFILLKIRDLHNFSNIVLNSNISTSQMVDMLKKENSVKSIYKLFNDIVGRHPILLNRAPTLHRLNIQAFSPLLINTKAVQLHPLVCGSFNADFDGDTMAVYVPHTIHSQIEARVLMMTSTNILSPATHEPIISPSQDMVFGLYYMTVVFEGAIGEGNVYYDIQSMKRALENKQLDLHAPMFLTQPSTKQRVSTTPGRALIYQMLFDYTNAVDINVVNKILDKKEITNLIKYVIACVGSRKASLVLDQLMALGFYYAYKAGISLHKNDINVPNLKQLFVERAQAKVDDYQKQYIRGAMSGDEKSKRLLNEWSKCSSMLTNQIFRDILHTVPSYKSSIYMLIHSGARGSMVQMRQLCGIRGLMIKPSGDILEIPIVSNFKEGLSVVDYFNSTHGARKGVIDTSLKTAISGYLTRKLFYASKDIFIVEEDCQTKKGILFGNHKYINSYSGPRGYYKNIVGRYLCRNIIDAETGAVILQKNQLISESLINTLDKYKVEHVAVRSAITCETRNGICRKCYGIGTDSSQLVSIGESIGIVAAQSIGEPGTQLTMRTFHLGGTVLKGGSDHTIYSGQNGRVLFMYPKQSIDTTDHSKYNISRKCKLLIVDTDNRIAASYTVPYGAVLYVKDGDYVAKDVLLFDWSPYSIPIIANFNGVVHYKNKLHNEHAIKRDKLSGHLVASSNKETLHQLSAWFIKRNGKLLENIIMPQDTIYMLDGTFIRKGNLIGRISASQGITQDITGGLSKISKLFECVQTHNCIIAPVEGFIVFGNDSISNKRTLYIHTKDKETREWSLIRISIIKSDYQLYVREHDYVYKGDVLSEGILPIRDMAERIGFQASFYNLTEQILNTYMENGVNVSQKHVEVIASQMYLKVADVQENKESSRIATKVDRTYNKDAKVKVKVKSTRYPKDYFYSKSISQLVMGLYTKNGKMSLGGISDVTFLSSSFLSSASFQKTSKVLTEASVWRGYDPLTGAQANLFFGYLVPLGTGSIKILKDTYLKNNLKSN
uniref:DNA-directed RNA polymerase subunit n=1 Tax=Histiona aroides TaxID=392300 RepID=M4QBS1_HISAR|nr:RNA polymerase subunit beta' [Histiona aroides]AGH24039.1 RNA polymerase subunit beta' [Histiona aroides]